MSIYHAFLLCLPSVWQNAWLDVRVDFEHSWLGKSNWAILSHENPTHVGDLELLASIVSIDANLLLIQLVSWLGLLDWD